MAASSMKEAINTVADRFHLPNGWLNADFTNTPSYSPKLVQYSEYYRTYSNIVTIRTVSAEYLVAMKLRSGRQYKNDLSDILGILAEHEKKGMPLTMDQIQKAYEDLYGDWDQLPENAGKFIENVMRNGHYEEYYSEIVSGENETNELLMQFENKYPGAVNGSNIDEILSSLRRK